MERTPRWSVPPTKRSHVGGGADEGGTSWATDKMDVAMRAHESSKKRFKVFPHTIIMNAIKFNPNIHPSRDGKGYLHCAR